VLLFIADALSCVALCQSMSVATDICWYPL
jgi:hypothetical protein